MTDRPTPDPRTAGRARRGKGLLSPFIKGIDKVRASPRACTINRLVLHLGDTKTGSTSIQQVLTNTLWHSPQGQIVYPAVGNHNGLAQTLTRPWLSEQRKARFGAVGDAFRASDAEFGVVSAEDFQFADPQALSGAIAAYWPDMQDRIHLIAYVRPHAGKLLSAFSECVKLGDSTASVDAFFDTISEHGGLDYTPRFEKWRAVFGDRFELRPFLRDQMYQGDAVRDFLKYVLDSEDFEVTGPAFSNASPTVSQLALMRAMHRHIAPRIGRGLEKPLPQVREAQRELGRGIADHLQASGLGQDGEKLRMPADLADRFVARYAADAAALDAAFFEGAPMSAALEASGGETVAAAQSLEAELYFAEDVIRSVQSFSDLLADVLTVRPSMFKEAIATARARVAGAQA